MHVIEGTWEEIIRHESELVGRHLPVVVETEEENRRQLEISTRVQAWNDFVTQGIPGVIVDDSRAGIFGENLNHT